MFDFVHKKKRIVQIILALATLPFLFWGIESYRSAGGEDYVASAAGEKISPQEFEQALRNQQENIGLPWGRTSMKQCWIGRKCARRCWKG